MPKTEYQRDKEAVKSIIGKYAGEQLISIPTLAKKAQITQTLLYSRLKDPDSFRRGELKRICKVLKIPDEEKLILL